MITTIRNFFSRWLYHVTGNATALSPEVKKLHVDIVAYDENLLERSRTQWQFGDWENLVKLEREVLEHHPDRAKLALLAAAGHQQMGNQGAARQFVKLAQSWGCSQRLVSSILISGVYNTLGLAALAAGQAARGAKHFENAIAIGTPGSEVRLLTQVRERTQRAQYNCKLEAGQKKISATAHLVRAPGENQHCLECSDEDCGHGNEAKPGKEVAQDTAQSEFSSAMYWNDRYINGGTSGFGSYGQLAEFKAKTINRFIKDEEISEAIEFGCGDGNQLSLFHIPFYIGVDVSPCVIEKCKERFKDDDSKKFLTNEEFLVDPVYADVTLSLDVIFHLIEDEAFEQYMRTLFSFSNKFCIIYSSNEPVHDDAIHVKRRIFTQWIQENIADWHLSQIIFNDFPSDGHRNSKLTSLSDFYIYKRIRKDDSA